MSQDRRVLKRQADAIRQLGACSSGPLKASAAGLTKSPQHEQQLAWDLSPVRLAPGQRWPAGLSQHHTGAKLGHAVLQLPLAGADVALQLPPALQLAATPAGSVDCRLQLLGVTADWPAHRQPHTAAGASSDKARVLPATSAAAGFACRSGALLLAHALFPDHAHGLLGWLAVPVAVADGLNALQSVVPQPTRAAVAVRASRLKDTLRHKGRKRSRKHSSSSAEEEVWGNGVGWVDGTGGVMQGSLHALRCLSGPVAALASAGWLWSVLHPSSHNLASCLVALAAVAADYDSLSKDISKGRVQPGEQLEAAWHVRHKRAAQRLAGYCADLPATPPLQPLLHAASCCSIAAGLAVDGQALTGLLAPGTAGGWLGSSSSGSSGWASPQLVLSLAVHEPTDGGVGAAAKAKQHEAAGLSRKQLLELFTGSGDEPDAAAAVSPAASAAGGALPAHGAGAAAGKAGGISRKSSTGSSATAASSADMTVHVLDDLHGHAEEAIASGLQQQLQLVPRQASLSAAPAAGSAGDPLALLEGLPLYGQQDHAQIPAALLNGSSSSKQQHQRWLQLLDTLQLTLRAVYLLLVFAPFLLLGAPMLLLSWYLLSRAAAAQQVGSTWQQQQQHCGTKQLVSSTSSSDLSDVVVISPPPPDSIDIDDVNSSWLAGVTAHLTAAQGVLLHPRMLLAALLQLLLSLLTQIAALLDLLLVLLLGGRWAAGIGAWESAGLFLRLRAWRLLLFSSRAAGAAFIKWGQWSSARPDIFPQDFCETLAALHDSAPVHSFRHSRKTVEAAFGKSLEQLFERFDPKPLASGSIAQVHRATLRRPTKAGTAANASAAAGLPAGADDDELIEVVVKVCHPNVHRHICMDFKLLAGLSAAAARVPALRGLSLRESVAQFSHTMTAQTDLRVEAVHALRFSNNFSGVASSVQIPRPIPGLVSQQALVETYEPGLSVSQYMKRRTPINAHIVGLGVDAFLKMLLVDNFVHTDLHPGNILFRAVPHRHAAKQQQQQQRGADSSSSSVNAHSQTAAAAAAASPSIAEAALLLEQQLAGGGSSSSSTGPALEAQLVLLDFGLAEQLTPEVRHHFISFLNSIAAGDGLCAARHLLCWSHTQACEDPRGFAADVMDLFAESCQIDREAGIDLDAVMKAVLGLARKWGVSIDSCYASLVISVCVLVGFAQAMDPGVNIMDAATPGLLAYSLTGKVMGRLYS